MKTHGEQSLSLFDYATRLGFPLVLVVVAVAQLRDQTWWFWGALLLASISFVIGIYHPTKKRLVEVYARWQDEKTVKNAIHPFRQHVLRFGDFVDMNSSSRLGKVIQDDLRKIEGVSRRDLNVTKESLFQGFWRQLVRRLDRREPSLDGFVDSYTEFNYLLSAYMRHTVHPVYRRMPQVADTPLPNRLKRDLEAFREKLDAFLNAYEGFAENLVDSLESEHLHKPSLERPKPLA